MNEKGTVYFFTGLSGAGKTTLGSLFYKRLKNTKPNAVYLDGDEIRPVFGEDSGYTQEDRLRWAGRIFRVCKMLSDQGIDVIVCSIAMFSSVREWNRENITNYKEIYVKVTKETLLSRNQKGLYTNSKNVVGVDLPFDEPKSSDIVINNDGEKAPLEQVMKIERVLYPNIVQNPIDNTVYWNRYYNNKICSEEPSPFAKYVATLIDSGKNMVELGCGNGRDAKYFASLGINVLAIDMSSAAIDSLNNQNIENAKFVCGDFVNIDYHKPNTYDYVYSRFTIHSINHNQQRMLLQNMFTALKSNGKFFIEVRGVNDTLFGKGEALERNAFFYDNHYRRFIVFDEILKEMQENGFRIEYAKESTGFAPYGNDDPCVIRIVAVKP